MAPRGPVTTANESLHVVGPLAAAYPDAERAVLFGDHEVFRVRNETTRGWARAGAAAPTFR